MEGLLKGHGTTPPVGFNFVLVWGSYPPCGRQIRLTVTVLLPSRRQGTKV